MAPPLPLSPDYVTARDDLRSRIADLATRECEHTVHAHAQMGPAGEELAADLVWLGPEDATAVVLVVSGTHGVEGYAGSALQRTWLRDLEPARPDDVAVCVLHALNPFGFAWDRRVNEDNVDVNRNFVDFSAPPANPGYDGIADLLVPPRWDEATQASTTEALLAAAADVGFDRFQEWVSGGQFAHPTGVFYGGREPVWSHRLLDDLCAGPLAGRDRVAIIDLHTGLGPWGVGELISSDAPDSASYRRAVDWYGDDVTSLAAGDSVSAQLTGEWLPAVARALAPAEVTGVALEFGTVDTVTVLQALRADAWLHAHGAVGDAPAIRAAVRAAFADDDPAWIAALADRFHSVLAACFDALRGG